MRTRSSLLSTGDTTLAELAGRDVCGPVTDVPAARSARPATTGLPARASRGAGAGDVGCDNAGPTARRLLSVVELQGALRAVRTPEPATAARDEQSPSPTPGPVPRWVAVLGAHGGAGASTVALALADAAAARGHAGRLVSCAVPARSALWAVPTVELGVSGDGHWRSGRRGEHLAVDRFNGPSHDAVGRLTLTPSGATDAFTVVDVDSDADGRGQDEWLWLACAVVLVFRVTVPGVRQTERVLNELEGNVGPGRPGCLVLGATVGRRRWPRVVASSAGPLLRRLRSDGRVVTIPVDPRLEVTGPTSSALPRAVLRAGEALLAELAPAMQAARPAATALAAAPLTPVVSLVPAAGPDPLPGALLAKEKCA